MAKPKIATKTGASRIKRPPEPINPLTGSNWPAPTKREIRSPDWSRWSALSRVELWQAIALTCNVEPDDLPIYFGAYPHLGDDPFRTCPIEFNHRLKEAVSHAGSTYPYEKHGTFIPRFVVAQENIISWASSRGWTLPDPLRGNIHGTLGTSHDSLHEQQSIVKVKTLMTSTIPEKGGAARAARFKDAEKYTKDLWANQCEQYKSKSEFAEDQWEHINLQFKDKNNGKDLIKGPRVIWETWLKGV